MYGLSVNVSTLSPWARTCADTSFDPMKKWRRLSNFPLRSQKPLRTPNVRLLYAARLVGVHLLSAGEASESLLWRGNVSEWRSTPGEQ